MVSNEHEKRLSIGLLAHNEEARIEETLRSLFAQDVFQHFATEIVIVANGCTDKTVAIAEHSLADHQGVWAACGSARVEEITTAGKTNAWNQFVHRFSSPQASVLVLMDADIKILNPNTISSMVATLQGSPRAVICVDRNVKDIEIKANRTLFERLLVAAHDQIFHLLKYRIAGLRRFFCAGFQFFAHAFRHSLAQAEAIENRQSIGEGGRVGRGRSGADHVELIADNIR